MAVSEKNGATLLDIIDYIIRTKWLISDYVINRPFFLTNSLDLMKSSEVRKAGDRPIEINVSICYNVFLIVGKNPSLQLHSCDVKYNP